jgi:hypothetical protein
MQMARRAAVAVLAALKVIQPINNPHSSDPRNAIGQGDTAFLLETHFKFRECISFISGIAIFVVLKFFGSLSRPRVGRVVVIDGSGC